MTIFAGGEDLERLDNWAVAEHVSSMTVLDFKDHLNTVISRVNQDPELLAYVHNQIKSLEGKRNPKRDLQAIADDITKVLDSNGYITWKQAKDSYDLDNAKQFERVMKRVPNQPVVRSYTGTVVATGITTVILTHLSGLLLTMKDQLT